MMKLKKITLPAAGLLMVLGMPTQAAVIWDFNYTDVGVGFNDATDGAARQGALESAGTYLSSFLTGYNATIKMDVDGSVADGSTLAAAGSNFNGPISTGFGNQGDVMMKILGGDAADPNVGAADGSVTWNFSDFQWELGADFQPGEYDFFSTAVHELVHALGFASDIAQNGDDPVTGDPTGNWSPFDNFVADSIGELIDDTSFSLDITRWNSASLGGACDTGLLFTGANAMAANGGNAVALYSPNTWEDGSSGSHLDDQCYSGTYMMEAATGAGLSTRQISAVEVGMMRDIGYTQFGVNPSAQVPAPPAIFLLAGGLALLGYSRRNFKVRRAS